MAAESLHKRSISSMNDLEKSIDSANVSITDIEEEDDEFETENGNHRFDIVYIIVGILLMGTFINFMFLTGSGTSGKNDLESFGGQQDAEINKFLNVDNINLKDVESNEWWKITHPTEVPKTAVAVASSSEIELQEDYDDDKSYANDKNTQREIVEMLSINPIVILTNDMNLVQELKVRDIFTNLKLTPEVQFVQLNKHPNYTKILKYLKDYNVRAYQYDNIASYTQTSYQIEDLDIPRLFIGGLPIANFNDIINKHKNNELHGFLRNYGQGLIKLDV